MKQVREGPNPASHRFGEAGNQKFLTGWERREEFVDLGIKL